MMQTSLPLQWAEYLVLLYEQRSSRIVLLETAVPVRAAPAAEVSAQLKISDC